MTSSNPHVYKTLCFSESSIEISQSCQINTIHRKQFEFKRSTFFTHPVYLTTGCTKLFAICCINLTALNTLNNHTQELKLL